MRPLWKKFKTELNIWSIGALPGLLVIAALVGIRMTGSLQLLEWAAFDLLLRWRPEESLDEQIVIIGIQETDIQQAGGYPLSDREFSTLLTAIQSYHPATIGLDVFRDLPVEPGHTEFVNTLGKLPYLIGVEQATGTPVKPPPQLPPERIGFADVVFDDDGKLRRSLLGTFTETGDFRFSLAMRLAEAYLARSGFTLENGVRDHEAMRFGTTEFDRFQANTGGYVRANPGGNQVLINFRSGPKPFRILSLQAVKARRVNPQWLRDRIVLIGYMAPSVRDAVTSMAIERDNPALVYGVEAQAHMVSQLIHAVQQRRPLLRTWQDSWEYVWIVGWGVVGISLGRFTRSPLKIVLGLLMACGALIGSSYGLILLGWWVPLVPAGLALVLNGAGLAAALFYRYDQDLRSRLKDRQFVIDQTFNTIHNGPLQTLARLLKQVQSDELNEQLSTNQLRDQLQQLNQELRGVYDSVRQEALSLNLDVYLGQDQKLDLQDPLHELLYAVYSAVLERDFPCFRLIKLQVTKFEPLLEQHLTTDQKRGLCRFLEEALCNVGKHAIGATRLEVTCMQCQGKNLIRVVDNGIGLAVTSESTASLRDGLGTTQAKRLAKQLKGAFRRTEHPPLGTLCELTWSQPLRWGWLGRSLAVFGKDFGPKRPPD